MSTGLIKLDCSGVTTEDSAICVLFLIKHGDFIVLVTLTAFVSSINVDIQRKISKVAVSVKFSSEVTVPVEFHSDGLSTKAVIVFVVIDGIFRSSSVSTIWGLALFSLVAVMTCIVNWRETFRPCVVSMTTLFCLIKCISRYGLVKLFMATKCSANVRSPISNLGVVAANRFSHWPFTICKLNFGGSSVFRILTGLVV